MAKVSIKIDGGMVNFQDKCNYSNHLILQKNVFKTEIDNLPKIKSLEPDRSTAKFHQT